MKVDLGRTAKADGLSQAEPQSTQGLVPSGFDPLRADEYWLLVEELRGLAIELHRRHFANEDHWQLSRTPRGVLAQIGNMASAMAAKIDRLSGALSWIEPPFVDENTSPEELRNRVQFAVADASRTGDRA